MDGHPSPNRLESQIPTLKEKTPNFQDKAIELNMPWAELIFSKPILAIAEFTNTI